MKTIFFYLLLILPQLTSGQFRQNANLSSNFYVGTDAFIRRENIQLIDEGNTVLPSDWMWNVSYGVNAGLRVNKWATVETGLYRFTLANRANFQFVGFSDRSFSEPQTVFTVPLRFYIDPFAFSQAKPRRVRLQLMGGVSAGFIPAINRNRLDRYSGQRSYLVNDVITDQLTYSVDSRLVSSSVVNIETGLNMQYGLGRRLVASATYGYMWGMHTVHRQTIEYSQMRSSTLYNALQTSAGSGVTIMAGLKYQFGPTVW